MAKWSPCGSLRGALADRYVCRHPRPAARGTSEQSLAVRGDFPLGFLPFDCVRSSRVGPGPKHPKNTPARVSPDAPGARIHIQASIEIGKLPDRYAVAGVAAPRQQTTRRDATLLPCSALPTSHPESGGRAGRGSCRARRRHAASLTSAHSRRLAEVVTPVGVNNGTGTARWSTRGAHVGTWERADGVGWHGGAPAPRHARH